MTGVLDVTAQRCDTTDLVHDRILDAAEELICTRGIAGFTLDGVAQAAGVSKGGLLYHFRSKDSLISGTQHRMASRMAETLRGARRGRSRSSRPSCGTCAGTTNAVDGPSRRCCWPVSGRNLARNCKPSWLASPGKVAMEMARDRRCSCWQP